MGMLAILLVILGVLVVIVIAVAAYVMGLYNKLVKLKQRVENALSQIDVQLKRRHDLIPKLVETVKGYVKHERGTLEAVIAARAKAVSASGVNDKVNAENELSSVLSRLMMVVEQYPDLKANRNFLELQEEITSTENRIAFARQHFNDNVMLFNTSIQVFPANIIAGVFNFINYDFFKAAEGEKKDVEVKF